MSDLADLFTAARVRLAAVPRETLGEWRTPKAVFGVARAPRIVDVGSAWHVGALLIGDDEVWSVGEIVRAQDPGRRGYAAESARARAEVRAAALRGKIPEGAVVHLGYEPIDLRAVTAGESSGPLRIVDGEPMIRWSTAGGFAPLAGYLDERVGLLVDPVPGAN